MTGKRGAAKPIPTLEWVVAGIGALLVAGMIGYLVLHALVRNGSPPDVRVVALRVVALESGWLVEFRALNAGAQPAATLLIEGELSGPAGVETSEATIDYLPARSARTGGLIFSRDPRAHELQLRAKSYVDP